MSESDERASGLLHVVLEVTAQLGRCSMPLREILQLGSGTVVSLDRAAGSPIDLLVNDELIARGELISVDERYGVHVTELVPRASSRS